MAPLAMACSLVPRDRAMAISNASDYGAPPASTATPTTDSTGNLSSSPQDRESSRVAESREVEQGYGSPARIGIGIGSSVADSSSVSLATPSPDGSLRRRPDRAKRRLLDVHHDAAKVGDGSSSSSGEGEGEGEGEGLSSSWGLLEHDPGGWAGERDRDTRTTWQEDTAAELSGGGLQRHHPAEELDGVCGGSVVVVSPPRGGVSSGGEGHDPTVPLLGSLNSGESPCCSREEEDSFGTTAGRRTRSPKPTLATTTTTTSSIIALEDVREVADRPVFCCVVLGAAATAAVTAGMSTFGTSFVTSLEFLSSESAAAATFGGVICAAGLAGTPAGGALIDATDPEGRLGDERKLAMVLTQATALMCVATGEKGWVSLVWFVERSSLAHSLACRSVCLVVGVVVVVLVLVVLSGRRIFFFFFFNEMNLSPSTDT